jgi:hypothetical protein
MYSHEGVDRKGIITSIVGTDNQAHNAFNAEYMSYVLHVNYRFAPKWNLFAKGMYETASVYKASDEVEKGKYRTAWGYAGGIEFYPMESNLHFFLAYVGRSYKYTDRAKALGEDNFSTHRGSEIIYQCGIAIGKVFVVSTVPFVKQVAECAAMFQTQYSCAHKVIGQHCFYSIVGACLDSLSY